MSQATAPLSQAMGGTAEELAALGERVQHFAAVVGRVCREKIAALRAAAEASGQG